jgi:hypothetical protein
VLTGENLARVYRVEAQVVAAADGRPTVQVLRALGRAAAAG